MNEIAVADGQLNPYTEMAPAAKSALRRILLNSDDEKLVISIAEQILDREGSHPRRGKDNEAVSRRPIVITDSNVQLLMVAGNEVSDGTKQET